MDALQSFADHHPLAVGAIGTVSGLAASALKYLHTFAGIAADVGIILSCAVALVSLLLLLHRWKFRDRPRFTDRIDPSPDDLEY